MNRILFVSETLNPLGPAQPLLELVRVLTSRGWIVNVAVARCENLTQWKQDWPCEVFALTQSAAEKSPAFARQRLRPASRSSVSAVLQLRKLIRRVRPEIVHAWCGTASWLSLVAVQFPISRRLLHHPWLGFRPSGQGVRASSTSQRILRPKLFATELLLPPEKRFTQQLYENRFSPGLESVLVPHEWVASQLRKNGCESNIKIIPNRIDANHFVSSAERAKFKRQLREKLQLPVDAKLAGTVAPLLAKSRLKDLIWATDLLTCVRDDFHFVIFGNGDFDARLRRFAGLTEAAQHVHFVNDPTIVPKNLSGLDFYWHSHLNEPMPFGLLNAMAGGVPAISVFGPGTRELIRHQETGFAVNFGARDEFARWTKYLIEQPDSAKQLAEQGQSWVQREFCGDVVEDYVRCWSESMELQG